MDVDNRQDSYRAVNEDGYWFIVKIEHDATGEVVGVSGPVFPQAAHPDDLRVQLIQMQTALESPISKDQLAGLGKKVKVNLKDGSASRTDDDVAADGAFTGSSEIPVERNALEEELTTRAAQAAQHIAERRLEAGEPSPPPEVAVAMVPKQADPEALHQASREMSE